MKRTFQPSNLKRARTHGFPRAYANPRRPQRDPRASGERQSTSHALTCPASVGESFPARLKLTRASDFQQVFKTNFRRGDQLYNHPGREQTG